MDTTHLLLIDPQNDFCDLPAPHAPALPVPGADADMRRLARFIDAAGQHIDALTVTLDSHHRLDIAHPTFWQRADGGAPSPFTAITSAQLRAGEFLPREPSARERVQAYLDALEAGGRYTLMVWPVHCEIGTWGHGIHAAVQSACGAWEERCSRSVDYVLKGLNPWTEHYSAVQAEVPLPDDEGTQLNRALLDRLGGAGRIVVAGEAGSHCVKATVEHLVEHGLAGRADRLVLLTDAMSSVGGFEAQQAAFLAAMAQRGARLATTTELLADLVHA
jgi:nicotinamidase-related amidase